MTENHGETVREYNPRFLQYARSQGLTPEEVLARDSERWPGGKMVGFILWNDEQVWGWCQETSTDRHWAGLHFDEISEWINKRFGIVTSGRTQDAFKSGRDDKELKLR